MRYLILTSILLSSAAASQGPHVHGLARLTVTLDAPTLTIALESPLDNLLGFEHEPRTTEQRAALAEMVAALQAPASLFAPTAAADCAPVSVVLESPLLASDHYRVDAHDHHHHDHGPEHDFHEHDHSHGAGQHHTDLYAEFIFDCTSPDALRGIDVAIFVRFPRLTRIDAEIAVPGLQTATRLDAQNTTLLWR